MENEKSCLDCKFFSTQRKEYSATPFDSCTWILTEKIILPPEPTVPAWANYTGMSSGYVEDKRGSQQNVAFREAYGFIENEIFRNCPVWESK